MIFSTVKENWKYLKKTYSMKRDISTYYEIRNKIFNTKQTSLLVVDYYGNLNGLWIKLDNYQSLKMTCKANTSTLQS